MAAAPAANTPPLQIDDKSMLPDTCYSKRPDGITTDTIVIHYTSAIEIKPADPYNLEAILDLFKGKIPGNPPVSSHYLIARDGKILLLVPESMRAWHAGFSTMPPPDSRDNVNDFSIGIELMATANDSVTDAQYTSLILLIKDIQTRYKIPLKNVVGHDTIRAYWNLKHPDHKATDKVDPGPLFHWSRLLEQLNESTQEIKVQ